MAYTEVSLDDASAIVEATGLSELLSIEKLAGGWANSNYILTLKDNTKLVLKIWNEQSLKLHQLFSSSFFSAADCALALKS
ncbi:hypothetical protein OAM96_01985 [Candidatus Poseidoniaceae archaeon]|nr:hypothetical protein [Candidatus Poseidoniaceae archaeon]